MGHPLVNVYSLLLKMAIEIVDLPIKNIQKLWCSIVFLNGYQRVTHGF
jgi:hypothetical protein